MIFEMAWNAKNILEDIEKGKDPHAKGFMQTLAEYASKEIQERWGEPMTKKTIQKLSNKLIEDGNIYSDKYGYHEGEKYTVIGQLLDCVEDLSDFEAEAKRLEELAEYHRWNNLALDIKKLFEELPSLPVKERVENELFNLVYQLADEDAETEKECIKQAIEKLESYPAEDPVFSRWTVEPIVTYLKGLLYFKRVEA